jgi:hypothetical protein
MTIVAFPDVDVSITVADIQVDSKAVENLIERSPVGAFAVMTGLILLVAGANVLKRAVSR